MKRTIKGAIIGALSPIAVFGVCTFALSVGVTAETLKIISFSIMVIILCGILGVIIAGY